MAEKEVVRTRIAPSPTGEDLHIGNIYTGLMNYAWAKRNNGQFVLRIEDTDRERLVPGTEERIMNTLKMFGLDYDEGPDIGGPFAPYRQSDRKEIYQKYAQELIDKGHAEFNYYPKNDAGEKKDYSSGKPEEKAKIEAPEPPSSVSEMIKDKSFADWVVRMKIPDRDIVFKDEIRGEIKFPPQEVSKQVLLKSDGFPTYHLGVVVDDHLMEISHVIRAEEWISSTPKHVLLYDYFGWEKPEFIHVPLLRNEDKSKLSKRRNPVQSSWYIENGFLPEAILNYLALQGWSHPEGKEIFSLDEFIRLYDPKDMNPVGPVFNIKKLTQMNGEYIKAMDDQELLSRLDNFEGSLNEYDQDVLLKMVAPAKSRMTTLLDYKKLVEPFVGEIPSTEKQELRNILKVQLEGVSDWNTESILNVIKNVATEQNVKIPDIYEAVIGVRQGLNISEAFEILGKDITLERLS